MSTPATMNIPPAATAMPTMSPRDVAERLARLTAGRILAGEQLVAATRAAGASALVLVGSLAQRSGDAFSDLDLLIVTNPSYQGIEPSRVFGRQLLTHTADPDAAPHGGAHTSVCVQVAGVALWLDLHQWPIATAAIPADALIVYAHLDLPYSPLGFDRLLDHHAPLASQPHPPTASAELRRLADSAKHLARGHQHRIAEHFPHTATRQPDQIASILHQKLATLDPTGLLAAIAATSVLIDLADTARTTTTACPPRTATTPDRRPHT